MEIHNTFAQATPFVHAENCIENLSLARVAGGNEAKTLVCPRTLDNRAWEDLIDSIGTGHFFARLLACLEQVCAVDHAGLFQLHDSTLSVMAVVSHDQSDWAARRVERYTSSGLWRFDPTINHIRQGLLVEEQLLIKVNLDGLSHGFREKLYGGLGDKLVVSGARKSVNYSLNLFKDASRGRFCPADIDGLLRVAGPIISVIAKHWESRQLRPDRALLASVPQIEATVRNEARLTAREQEVCARIVYGMCQAGIALDLGVGEETIKTYRNRAYQKLGIGSQRELLLWYLSIWNPFEYK